MQPPFCGTPSRINKIGYRKRARLAFFRRKMTGGVFTKFDVTYFTPSVKRFAFDSSLGEGAELLM